MNHLERSAITRLAAQHLRECNLGPLGCEECVEAETVIAEEDERMTCEGRDER